MKPNAKKTLEQGGKSREILLQGSQEIEEQDFFTSDLGQEGIILQGNGSTVEVNRTAVSENFENNPSLSFERETGGIESVGLPPYERPIILLNPLSFYPILPSQRTQFRKAGRMFLKVFLKPPPFFRNLLIMRFSTVR